MDEHSNHENNNDETSIDDDDYEPLPSDHYPLGTGSQDNTLPKSLVNSTALKANVSDFITVELLCVIDDIYCNKVLMALKDAAQELAHVLYLKDNILIRAAYYEFCDHSCANNTFGLGAPSSQFTLPFKDDDMDFLYPQALAKQLSPYKHPSAWATHDIVIELNHDPYMNAIINTETVQHDNNNNNGTGIPPFGKYWFKKDPDIKPYQIDFQYIILHEILHGLGFISSWAAYFSNDISPFRTLLNNIFHPTDLQYVTPSLYWTVQPPSGPTFVTGFQPTMIFDKFLYSTLSSITESSLKSNHISLMELGFNMQDYCVQGYEAFIINFVQSFKKSNQSQQSHQLYSMLNEGRKLTFEFGLPNTTTPPSPPLPSNSSAFSLNMTFNANSNSSVNSTFELNSYLSSTYTHMPLFTGSQVLNSLNHHEQTGRLFRPGIMIAHMDDALQTTPDFIMTSTYQQGKTLDHIVNEVYKKVPEINYHEIINKTTSVERVYQSSIGPGILRILDMMGYTTVLSDVNDILLIINDQQQQQQQSTSSQQPQQQSYNHRNKKKTYNNHRNVCDDMHSTLLGLRSTKQSDIIGGTSDTCSQKKNFSITITIIWIVIIGFM
ncbi:hypothetical protein BJ944DRAFT_165283 [Cunninghamella echinulata]|nr:hypothetical protein BJ944DRAFT_165283 [Cunninghamella echinulata]